MGYKKKDGKAKRNRKYNLACKAGFNVEWARALRDWSDPHLKQIIIAKGTKGEKLKLKKKEKKKDAT